MKKTILVVDTSTLLFDLTVQYWNKHKDKYDVDAIYADSVDNAVRQIINEQIWFIEINEDTINYMQELEIINNTTEVPIIVIVTTIIDEHNPRVYKLGADTYTSFQVVFDSGVTTPEGVFTYISEVCSKVIISDVDQLKLHIISNDSLHILIAKHMVYLEGKEIKLQKLEFALLCYMYNHANQIITLEQIYFAVWGRKQYNKSSYYTIKNHCNDLKIKLSGKYIENVWGVGYRFVI